MTKEQRSERKSVWEENEFFLEGHHEYLTIISFYIVNKRAEFKKKEGLPSFLLVELPLKVGKKLAITAAWEIEQGLKSDVENALRRTPLEKKIIEDHLGQTLAISVTGECGMPNSVYMVNFPIVYSNSNLQDPLSDTPE